jgi:hypothetical protein
LWLDTPEPPVQDLSPSVSAKRGTARCGIALRLAMSARQVPKKDELKKGSGLRADKVIE